MKWLGQLIEKFNNRDTEDDYTLSEYRDPALLKEIKDIAYNKSVFKDLQSINRFEVIDKSGRAYVNYFEQGSVRYDIQDEGKTLKVFIDD